MSSSRIGRPVILAAAAVLLSSCGSVSSGVAASIGPDEVSVANVDALADAMCANVEDQIVESGQAVPMKLVRQTALNILTLDTVARQIADENGVVPGPDYERAVTQARSDAAELPEDQREDYVVAGAIDALIDSVILQVGTAALQEEGVAEPSPEKATKRGSEIFWTWPQSRDIDINPLFDLEEVEGQLRPVTGESGGSVAVSASAVAEAEEQPDPARTAGLPDHMRCG